VRSVYSALRISLCAHTPSYQHHPRSGAPTRPCPPSHPPLPSCLNPISSHAISTMSSTRCVGLPCGKQCASRRNCSTTAYYFNSFDRVSSPSYLMYQVSNIERRVLHATTQVILAPARCGCRWSAKRAKEVDWLFRECYGACLPISTTQRYPWVEKFEARGHTGLSMMLSWRSWFACVYSISLPTVTRWSLSPVGLSRSPKTPCSKLLGPYCGPISGTPFRNSQSQSYYATPGSYREFSS
jgi:hypothetical protein